MQNQLRAEQAGEFQRGAELLRTSALEFVKSEQVGMLDFAKRGQPIPKTHTLCDQHTTAWRPDNLNQTCTTRAMLEPQVEALVAKTLRQRGTTASSVVVQTQTRWVTLSCKRAGV